MPCSPGQFQLTFTPTSVTAATSTAFVQSDGADRDLPSSTTRRSAVIGVAFTGQPSVTIQDASGNTVTTSTVNVVATIASGNHTLAGPTQMAAVSGVATVTN